MFFLTKLAIIPLGVAKEPKAGKRLFDLHNIYFYLFEFCFTDFERTKSEERKRKLL